MRKHDDLQHTGFGGKNTGVPHAQVSIEHFIDDYYNN